jgi:hypothetical protein
LSTSYIGTWHSMTTFFRYSYILQSDYLRYELDPLIYLEAVFTGTLSTHTSVTFKLK